MASLVFLVPWGGASCRTRRRGGEREELRVWSHFEACLDRNSQLSLLPAAGPRPHFISLMSNTGSGNEARSGNKASFSMLVVREWERA